MKPNILFPCVMVLTTLACGVDRAAGFYKCVDGKGSVSYQDTDCGPGTTSVPINRRYANSVSNTVSPEDKALVKQFEAMRMQEHQQRLQRIGHTLQSWRAKAEECNSLKKRWYRYLDTHQLARKANSSPKAELLRRMRQACST